MSYGLNIFKASGALSYSTDEVTWNQVGVMTCPASGSVTKTFPALEDREHLVVQVPIDPPSLTKRTYAHTISVSGTTVTASGGNTAALILVMMR